MEETDWVKIRKDVLKSYGGQANTNTPDENKIYDFIDNINKGIIEKDTEITLDNLHRIGFLPIEVSHLMFRKYEDESEDIKYKIRFNCFRCKKWQSIYKTKQEIFAFLEFSKRAGLRKIENFKETLSHGLCDECWEKRKDIELLRSKNKTEQETTRFIRFYFAPGDPCLSYGEEMWPIDLQIMLNVYTRGDKEQVRAKIRSMKYKDFLKTSYWNIISRNLKRDQGNKCKLCNTGKRVLNLHHSTYDILGSELDNLDKLICLCQPCHSKFHNIG